MSRPARPIKSCDGCGACCSQMGSPPFSLDGPDWQRLPAVLKAELNAPVEYTRPDGSPCSWLTEAGTCRHYYLRPDICREFRRGSFACREWRVELGLSVLSNG